MQIKIFKNEVKLTKFFLKILRKDIKKNPYIRIGIDGEGLSFLFDDLINFTKIDWNFVRIFSPVEYFDGSINSPTSFSEILKNKLVKNLNNFNLENFEYLTEKINFLKSKNAINGLYKYKDNLDLLVFYLDYRGNFLHNDYESKISFLNFSTNGNKIVSPGIKSILLAKKIIFICKDDNEKSMKIVKNFVSKKIIENDIYTFLNFHENFYFLTLKNLVNKSDIALSVSNQDYNLWHDIISSNDLKEIDDLHEKENKNLDIIPQINTITKDDDLTYIERNETINTQSLNDELNQALLEDEEKLIQENNNLIEENNFVSKDEKETSIEPEILINTKIDNNVSGENASEKNEGFSLGIIDDIKKIISEEKKLDENIFSNLENEKDNDISFDLNYKDDLNNNNDHLFEEIDSEIKIENNINNFANNNEEDDREKLIYKEDNKFLEAKQEDWFLGDDLKLETPAKQEDWFLGDDLKLETPPKQEYVQIAINQEKPIENNNSNLNFYHVTKKINKEDILLNDIDKIKKIIEIKQTTLKDIEKIILEMNNKKIPIEKFLSDKQNNEKIFKYCPGNRPCPLLAVFDNPNQKQYEEIIFNMKVVFSSSIDFKPFDNSLKHLWNHSSYISYNEKTLEINLVAFIDISYLIFLLRSLNKDLWFKTSGSLLDVLEKNVAEYDKEFLLLTPNNC